MMLGIVVKNFEPIQAGRFVAMVLWNCRKKLLRVVVGR